MLVAVSVSAFAGDRVDGRQWLERMASTMSQMDYQGTFVYSQGTSLETMRITHLVDDTGIRERLYSVNGPHREVLRDKDGVRCVLGDDKSIMEDPMVSGAIFPDIPAEMLGHENGSYTITTGRISRVAGHLAQKISIKPVDEFRYGYELWLEQFSGLLLKWVLYDNARKPIARLMFTELSLGADIQPEELISSTPSEEFVKLDSGMPDRQLLTRTKPKWKPSSLPPGFKLAAHSIQEKEGDSVFEHQVYSDGLASVSVYIENRSEDSDARQGTSKIGTANAFSLNIGPKLITVIGEVPRVTVLSIGHSVLPPVTKP
jgi:sigma-E factor negative regulatory protein RseB